jgi:hypothetical protein
MGPMVSNALTVVCAPSDPEHAKANPDAWSWYRAHVASVPGAEEPERGPGKARRPQPLRAFSSTQPVDNSRLLHRLKNQRTPGHVAGNLGVREAEEDSS